VETCDTLIGKIEEVEALVGGKGARRKSTGAGETDADADASSVSDRRGMIDEWEAVEESGRRVEEMAQNLLQERDALVSLSNALSARLEFFTELDHATRMLNRPGTLLGENLALQSDFLDMVERVDVCIGFLEGHVCVFLCLFSLISNVHSDNTEKPTCIFSVFTNALPAL